MKIGHNCYFSQLAGDYMRSSCSSFFEKDIGPADNDVKYVGHSTFANQLVGDSVAKHSRIIAKVLQSF